MMLIQIARERLRALETREVKSLRPLWSVHSSNRSALSIALVRGRVAEHQQETNNDREQWHLVQQQLSTIETHRHCWSG